MATEYQTTLRRRCAARVSSSCRVAFHGLRLTLLGLRWSSLAVSWMSMLKSVFCVCSVPRWLCIAAAALAGQCVAVLA